MSRTNVHSNQEIYCAGAQMVPTERDVEIPPKSAKKGPSNLEVVLGEGMDIPGGDARVDENNHIISDGIYITMVNPRALLDILKAKETRQTVAPSKYGPNIKDKLKRSGDSEIGE